MPGSKNNPRRTPITRESANPFHRFISCTGSFNPSGPEDRRLYTCIFGERTRQVPNSQFTRGLRSDPLIAVPVLMQL